MWLWRLCIGAAVLSTGWWCGRTSDTWSCCCRSCRSCCNNRLGSCCRCWRCCCCCYIVVYGAQAKFDFVASTRVDSAIDFHIRCHLVRLVVTLLVPCGCVCSVSAGPWRSVGEHLREDSTAGAILRCQQCDEMQCAMVSLSGQQAAQASS